MANLWPTYAASIAGGWKCVSFEQHRSSDSTPNPTESTLIAKPHGEEPLGRVLISPAGYLSAHMARPDRVGALPSGRPWQTGFDEEVARVARGLSMYCGYLELFEDAEGLWWQTRVECASDPTRIGGLEKRRVRLEEDGRTMVLQPFGEMALEDGTRARGILRWERFE